MSNTVVRAFWLKGDLSRLEQLTIKSFTAQGHLFELYSYNPDDITLKTDGLRITDARSILPEERVFVYGGNWHGTGSVAGFSDIFRTALLLQEGGWYVDMDVTCLRPLFDFHSPIVLRDYRPPGVPGIRCVANIIKTPPTDPIMLRIFQRYTAEVTESNKVWMLPLQILSEEFKKAGYLWRYGVPNNVLGLDYDLRNFVYSQESLGNAYAIHWNRSGCVNEWGVDFNNPPKGGHIERLYEEHGV